MAESSREPRPRVLVADPDSGRRRTVSLLLEAEGFACESTGDVDEALAFAGAGGLDLLVASFALLRPSGLETLRDRRSRGGSHPRLVVLGADPLEEQHATELGADAVLSTPLDPGELVREARRLAPRGDRPTGRTPRATGSETALVAPLPSAVAPSAPAGRLPGGDTERVLLDSGEFAATSAEEPALAGRLEALAPLDLIRALHAGGQSGRLKVATTDGRARAVIDLELGEVTTALVESEGRVVASGDQAFATFAAWAEGTFRLETPSPVATSSGPRPRNVLQATSRLLHAQLADSHHETAALANERLGEFELVERLSEPARIAVHRARRVGETGALVRFVLVERQPFRKPSDLEGLKRLVVPGAARLLAWGDLKDGRPWFETELPIGPTLEEHVRQRGPFPAEQALALFERVLETLDLARRAGFFHGGLDARRIVLPGNGRPVLLDLGLAPSLASLDERATVRAMAPELWQGRAPDSLSDLYAAGVLLFFALTGRYPFDDDNPLAVGHTHAHAAPPPLAAAGLMGAAPELEQALGLLLAKTPTARYATADVARAALEGIRNREKEKKAPQAESFGVPAPSGYRFLRRIGKGGSGEVYEALHETLGRVVAVKVISPVFTEEAESRARFLREARMAASLVHPGIVQVFDAREEGGRLYLVMELVEGEPLRMRLERESRLPEPEAIAIAASVLESIAAAHERGIIHRDVKPDNLLVSSTGRIKVADFGLATSLHAPDHLTQHGTVLGTPLYMSPEQCLAKPIDERSDLYSVGATLYHMLTGRPPFVAESVHEIMRRHVEERPAPISLVAPQVSKGLASIVERLLAKLPEDRFASAREVLNALFLTSVSPTKV